MFVSSVNEKGYLRTCCVDKLSDGGFREIYFVTSKRSEKQGKAKHFETNTNITLQHHFCFLPQKMQIDFRLSKGSGTINRLNKKQ